MNVNGVEVTVDGVNNVSTEEVMHYIDHVRQETNEPLSRLAISAAADGRVILNYELCPPKFERIRRITGYLVGTIDRWNNAKQYEEHDRVKHGVSCGKA